MFGKRDTYLEAFHDDIVPLVHFSWWSQRLNGSCNKLCVGSSSKRRSGYENGVVGIAQVL